MIYSFNSTSQTLSTNASAVFSTDVVKTGCTVSHTAGSTTFTLKKPGYYYVTLTAVATATAAETDPLILQLYNGTTAISGAIASASSTSATDVVDLTINAIIPVLPSCCAINNNVQLNVVNTGADSTISNITITITKLA